jgi:Nif-specific regulatory protein
VLLRHAPETSPQACRFDHPTVMRLLQDPSRTRPDQFQSDPAVSDHLLALAEVGRELTAQGELRERLERVMRVLNRRLGASAVLLCSSDDEHRSLEIEAAYGVPPQAFRGGYGQGVAGRVAKSGRPIVVPIARQEAMAVRELPELLYAPGDAQSLTCVPLFMAGRSAGALSVYFGASERADLASRVGVLEVVTSLISQALRAARLESLAEEGSGGVERARSVFEFANMIGASTSIRQVYEQIGQVAPTNATVLIRGESGTGKELVAQAVHDNSPRARAPFVRVNCAALPETLFESELFGHERGAFTGAHARKRGRFELAQGGTLFLDEIGELPLTTQAKLLRVLQFREFERLGGTETLRTDVRLIAATNKDMERAVAAVTFREDLYYRLNVFTMLLPPLRDRRADIPALADYFLGKFATEHRRRISRISSGALETLAAHGWPGNVRELENVIERAVVVCDGFVIQERHLPDSIKHVEVHRPLEQLTLGEAVAHLERRMIEDALRKADGNATRAARELGTTERIVRYKAQKHGIDAMRPRG